MSDVLELFGSAKTLYISGQIYFPPSEKDGEIRAVDVEHWVDAKNGRWRSVTPGMITGPKGMDISVSEQICDGGEFVLNLDCIKEEAGFSKLSRLQRELRSRGLLETVKIFVCGDPAYYDLYKIIGEEEINGRNYNIWELSVENKGMMSVKLQCWLSPTTGEFAQALVWMKSGKDDWFKQMHITTVELNKVIPDNIFAMDIPSNYTEINTRETAYKPQLSRIMGGDDPYLLNVHVLFPLQDGTVIACWSSGNKDSKDSQGPLFDKREVGGSFPELPFEVYAFNASVNGKQEVFHGRHLCYTELEGKFYEWGIYVPLTKIDSRQSRIQFYSVVYRSHCESKGPFTLATSPDLVIESDVDFENFVVEAIKEFSDQDEVPSYINYENILRMADEIRGTIGSDEQ
jgi:hypothetical protein